MPSSNGFRSLYRDWRFRMLLPVVLIHCAVFAGLYVVVYRLAINEVIATHQSSAERRLDEMARSFRNLVQPHSREKLQGEFSQIARLQDLEPLRLFDSTGRVVVTTTGSPTSEEVQEVAEAFSEPSPRTSWFNRNGSGLVLVGLRKLQNERGCWSCHGHSREQLGLIQMGTDLTSRMAKTRHRLRLNLGILAVIWAGLTIGVTRLRSRMIWRPLRRIERTISEVGGDMSRRETTDLDELTERLHGTVWGLIERQRQRERDQEGRMARVEQLAALGQVAAGLTHEIKNPLAGIAAALDVLRSDEAEGSEIRQVHDQILQDISRVMGTVDSLLALARPQPPRRVDTDLEKLARHLVSLFKPRLRGRRIQLEVEVSGPLPTLSLDPGRINQLLVNLLTNSMQAMGEDGKITVLLAPFPRNDGIILVVSDTGHGIERENLERVFDPFFTTKEEGTGLGLAICRQIVAQNGGTITLESEPGKGTRAVILLPGRAASREDKTDGADTPR